jgi:tetratricopeptide (TPR) repeat protein
MPRLTQRLGFTRYEADEYYREALQHYGKRKVNDAILSMERAIELLPTNAEYYAARGFFYLEDGIDKKAAVDFEKALELYSYEMMAHYGLGMIAYKAKKWDEAQEHFTNAYRANPERPETLYYLALSHHHKGENTPALAYMQQAEVLFEANEDKRKSQTGRWVRQLQKLAKQARLPEGNK